MRKWAYTQTTSRIGNMPRRRPEFGPGFAAPKQLNLKSLVMQAGSNSVAVRRRQKPILEVVCVYLFLLLATFAMGAEEIGGFWKSYDDNGTPQCIFGVYEHDGIYYGRIIGTYDDDGKMTDTIYHPTKRAEGVVGNPHTCGLDIVYNLQDGGSTYDGKIIDPSKGKTYNCSMWKQGEYLILRGKLFIFGKNITWYPASKTDFPKGFKLPDMKKFKPSIPQVN